MEFIKYLKLDISHHSRYVEEMTTSPPEHRRQVNAMDSTTGCEKGYFRLPTMDFCHPWLGCDDMNLTVSQEPFAIGHKKKVSVIIVNVLIHIRMWVGPLLMFSLTPEHEHGHY